MHFDAKVAFDFPPGSFNFSLGFLLGLGTASRVGAYDYLGYYDVCYIGDEVQSPGRVIPRSILISTIAVALIYIAINFSIIGVVPWREFVPVESHPQADFVVSIFMERIYGSGVATILTRALRGGARRLFLQGLCAAASVPGLPVRVAGGARRALDRRGVRIARHGDRRAAHDADPGAIHRADRRGDPAASARAGPAAALSDVALSGAKPHRAAGMDLHLCHDTAHGDRLWIGRAVARCGVLRGVVVEETNVAVRGESGGRLSNLMQRIDLGMLHCLPDPPGPTDLDPVHRGPVAETEVHHPARLG